MRIHHWGRMMPRMKGTDVPHGMWADERTTHLPVIVITHVRRPEWLPKPPGGRVLVQPIRAQSADQ